LVKNNGKNGRLNRQNSKNQKIIQNWKTYDWCLRETFLFSRWNSGWNFLLSNNSGEIGFEGSNSSRARRKSSTEVDAKVEEDVRLLLQKLNNRKEFLYYVLVYLVSTILFCLSVKFCSTLIRSRMYGIFQLKIVDLFNFSNITGYLSGKTSSKSNGTVSTGFWNSVFLWTNLLQLFCICVLHYLVSKGEDITTKEKINSFAEYNKEILFYSSAAQVIQVFLPLVWWILVLLLIKGILMLHGEYSWKIKYYFKRRLQTLLQPKPD